MTKKLSVRFTAYILITIVGLTIIFIPIYIHSQKSLYIDFETKEMEKFINGLENHSLSSDGEDIETYVDEYSDHGYVIRIFSENFDTIYTTRKSIGNMEDSAYILKKNIFKYTTDAMPQYYDGAGRQNRSLILRRMIIQNNSKYYVFCKLNLKNINTFFSYTNRTLIIILTAYIVICVLILLLLISRTTKYIRDLSLITQKIAERDYSVRYEGKIRNDEIGLLSKNINEMADTIQNNINSLSNYNFLLQEDINSMTEYETMRKRVICNVTHELKTPLAIISSQVEMMNCITDEKKKSFYYISAMEEINKMSNLITNLLSYSVAERDIFKDEVKTMNLSETVENLCKRSESFINSKKICLHTDIDKGLRLKLSENHIVHVFNNYIMNAVFHTKPGNEIIVKLKNFSDKARLSVYNQGELIKSEDKDRVWAENFTHNNVAPDKCNDHVGLGLFIVKEISTIEGTECGFINHKSGVEFWFDFSDTE